MSQYWSPAVRELTPYVPGEQPREQLVKLNTNENPYPPAPGVGEALRDYATDHLRLYPDPTSAALREALAETFQVARSQVFVGNGSDEVLAFAFQAFFRHGAPLDVPTITYSFYPVYANLYGVELRKHPLNKQWEVDIDALGADTSRSGVIFANPNAPTGHAHSLATIEALLKRVTDRVVLVDEAYVDFGAESAVSLIDRYPNLLVTGTFSKSRSLAGLRLGYAVGSEELIDGLLRVKDSFNSFPVDSLASLVGIAALKDVEHFEACRERVITTRERTHRRLEALGFEVLPSKANFVLAQHPNHEGAQLFAGLRERGILVRHFNTSDLNNFLRITIGTDDEMDSLIEALEMLL
ncbi:MULTISPECIES: histidinol-phosphate transaminase [Halomonadaceae]|uniref:Histidinol-phosphate aminotransferase n=1 Tax=Vreelandella titanicae TaxID=664683 RepID=A0A7H1VGQ4_9GAMM|nr:MULTISPECIES: histidinol-phosphate transaminase [Halomonas]QKS25221.1 Histidinol-phosphate aminotransferase [Halomonas titanicae]QNU64566.1 histidinol-phosphate transaminase [Halomonas titanicae]CDG53629.1 Histidinol-phosphate aminotransferase [Halomonas sp. A3H3]SDJ24715.1 histidinol phosphate aminotransferase apoenzyme [Halomonas titanicae]|tara:strand:+ start:864 stop:1922 length:1059 start_codon:yes stop_codon:yes gene_type:complete